MRKLVLAAAALLVALPLAGHAGVTVQMNRNFYISYYDTSSTSVYVQGNITTDVITGAVIASSVSVSVNSPSGYDGGFGNNVVADVDPLLLQGTISGSVQGYSGPITFNFSFLGTQVSTTYLGYAYAEPVPADPSVNAAVQQGHQGRVSGPVSSPIIGTVSVPNGYAFVGQYTTADARP